MSAAAVVVGLHLAALAGYALAAVAGPAGARRLSGAPATCAALLVHAAGLTALWRLAGHGPFMGRFEVLSADALALLAAHALLAPRVPALRRAGGIVRAMGLLVLGAALVPGLSFTPLPPAMDTPLVLVHSLAYRLAFAAAALAAALSVRVLLDRAELEPDVLRGADHAVWRCAGVAFALWTIGMLLGAVWAYHLAASLWSWDAVEVWALVAWGVLGTWLHLVRFFGIGRRALAGLYLAVFATLLVALYAAPMLRTSIHGGTFAG